MFILSNYLLKIQQCILLSILLFNTYILTAQFNDEVIKIHTIKNSTTRYEGDLMNGELISDLDWASDANIACFPATANKYFEGHHVLHALEMPAYSELSITLIPNNNNVNFSLYAYQISTNNYATVPNLHSCVSCEADYGEKDHIKTIKLVATNKPYNAVIGVSAEGLEKGAYSLSISLRTKSNTEINQEKVKVYKAPSSDNESKTYSGKLEDGVMIQDLNWASFSSMACFPATQNSKFNGNHLLYITEMKAKSEIEILIEPKDPSKNLSLYAMQVGLNETAMVPDIKSCVSCEVAHKWDYPKRGQSQDHTRSVKLVATNNPYKVIIGVAGADGLKDGDFLIQISTKVESAQTNIQKKPRVFAAAAEKGNTKAYKGNLDQGVIIQDLSWASNSAVACFPATQNSKFNGQHVFFQTELEVNSNMEITLVPTDENKNMSLYAFCTAPNSSMMVPELSSCAGCEADHKWDYPRRGKTQDHTRSVKLSAFRNPYRVIIGVAGADGLKEGDFIIKIKTE